MLLSFDKFKNLNQDNENKISEAERKRRRIYLENFAELIDKRYYYLLERGSDNAISFYEKNPIAKAIRFLSALDDKGMELEFDTPNSSAYGFENKYTEHANELMSTGAYSELKDKQGKPNKDIITNISFVYMIQHCVVKIIENKPMIETRNSGFVHMLDKSAIKELMSNTSIEEKFVIQLLERFNSHIEALLTEEEGNALVSIPKNFDYFHYRFENGVLDARTGMFFEGDTTTECMFRVRRSYDCSPKAKEIFEKLVDYLASDKDGVIDLDKRRRIIAFMLYPVSYNVSDKDISVLFGTGGNGKSVLGELMAYAYGSVGIGKSYLNATKKASGTYMNNEISKAFSKNTAFFDEESFNHIEQAEQMKHFIDQKITYEIRNLGTSSVDLAIRGVVIFNSNTSKLIGASRAHTWLMRRFTGMFFEFVFDNHPEAKEWIKNAFTNVNGVFANFTQADILHWLMEQRLNYSEAELEHPLQNVADVLALGDDIDEADIILDYISERVIPYNTMRQSFTALPEQPVGFAEAEYLMIVKSTPEFRKELGTELGMTKPKRGEIRVAIEEYTDIRHYGRNGVDFFILTDNQMSTPPTDPTPTKRDEIIREVAEEEGMTVEPNMDYLKDLMALQQELDALEIEEEPEEEVVVEEETETEPAQFQIGIIETNAGHVSNERIVERFTTDIKELMFPKYEDKSAMPKVFPDNRVTRGDYSKESSLMILDIDHINLETIEEVTALLSMVGKKMYVQQSYSSKPNDIGVHVFIPMAVALDNYQWNAHRNVIGGEIYDITSLKYDEKHAGFRGVTNGSFHEIIEIDGELEFPNKTALDFLVGTKKQREAQGEWTGDRMTAPAYFSMNSVPSQAIRNLFEAGSIDEFDGERNDMVFMIAKDLVSMQNRGAFQNGVFDELWEQLGSIVEKSADANEFISRMDSLYNDLEI